MDSKNTKQRKGLAGLVAANEAKKAWYNEKLTPYWGVVWNI